MEHKNRTAASRNNSTSHQQLQSSSDVQANSNRAASSFQSQSGEEVEFDYIDDAENELDLAALIAAETDFSDLQDDEDWSWFDELPKAKQECLATLLAASTQPYAVAFTARRKAALRRQHNQYSHAASRHKDTSITSPRENGAYYDKKQASNAAQPRSIEQSLASNYDLNHGLNHQPVPSDFNYNFGGNSSRQVVLNQDPFCSSWRPPKSYTSYKRRPYHNPNFAESAAQTKSVPGLENSVQGLENTAQSFKEPAHVNAQSGEGNPSVASAQYVLVPSQINHQPQPQVFSNTLPHQNKLGSEKVQDGSKSFITDLSGVQLKNTSVPRANVETSISLEKSPVVVGQASESIPTNSQYDASTARLSSDTLGSSISSSSVSGTVLYMNDASNYAHFGGFYMAANGLTMTDIQASTQTDIFSAPKITGDATLELAKKSSSGTLEFNQAQSDSKDGSLEQSSLASTSYTESKYVDASNLSWAFSLLAESELSAEQNAEATEQGTQAEDDKEEIDSGSASVQMSVAVDSESNLQPKRLIRQRETLDLSKDTFSQYDTEVAKELVADEPVLREAQFEGDLNSKLSALLNTSHPQISNFEQFREIVFCCMRQQTSALEKVTERSFQKYCLFIDKDTQHFTVNISFNAKGNITKIYSTGKSYAAQCCVKALKSLIGLTIASNLSLSPIVEPSSHSNVSVLGKTDMFLPNSTLSYADGRSNQSQVQVGHFGDFMGNVSSYNSRSEQEEDKSSVAKMHLEGGETHSHDSAMAEARTLVHSQEQIEQIVSNFLAQQKKEQEQSIAQSAVSVSGSEVLQSGILTAQHDVALGQNAASMQNHRTNNSLESASMEQVGEHSFKQTINSTAKENFAQTSAEQAEDLEVLAQNSVKQSVAVKHTSALEELECSPETWSKAQSVDEEMVAYTPHAIAFTDLIHNLSDQMEITLLQIVDKHYQKQCLMRNRFGDILKVLVYYKSSGEISKVRCAKDQLLSEIFTDALLAKKFIVGTDGRCMVV